MAAAERHVRWAAYVAQVIRLEAVRVTNSSGLQRFALEFAAAGEEAFSLAAADPQAYLARVEDFAEGRNLPPQRVRGREFRLFSRGSNTGKLTAPHEADS